MSGPCPFPRSTEATAGAGVPGGAGGVYQGRAEEPEEGVPPRPGGGEEDPEHSTRHRTVLGGRGPEHRHRGLHHRYTITGQTEARNHLLEPQHASFSTPARTTDILVNTS